MPKYRYLCEGDVSLKSCVRDCTLRANNQIPSNCDACFRITCRRDTEIVNRSGRPMAPWDTHRVAEMHPQLRRKGSNGRWCTVPLDPDDKRPLSEITTAVVN